MSDRPEYYTLDGHKAVPTDMAGWMKIFRSPARFVAKSEINGSTVSTVFLGLDHSFGGGPPMIFETMILSGPHADYQTRCSTWEEAEEMHRVACVLAEKGHEP